MTASRRNRTDEKPVGTCGRALALLFALLLVGIACAKHPPPPADDLLLPLTLPVRWNPEPSDVAAAALAAAALASDKAALEHSLVAVERAQDSHKTRQMLPICKDLVNATLDDAEAYRTASRRLTRGWGTDPALEARLGQEIDDDRLRLARRRSLDTWERFWARTFNAVSQPLGSSLVSGFVLAPFNLATSGVQYFAGFSNNEPIGLTDRQALALRREYLTRNPDSARAPEIRRKVEAADAKLSKTLQRRRLREAKTALQAGSNRLAVIQAERALSFGASEQAERIRDEGRTRGQRAADLRQGSLESSAVTPRELGDRQASALAMNLLAPSLPRAVLHEPAPGDRMMDSDEAQFVLAMAEHEAGFESKGWWRLSRLAARNPIDSHMSRHARALVADPWQDPYRAFQRLKRMQRSEHIKWRLVGDWAKRTRYPNLPRAVGYLIDAPAVAQMIIMTPLRLIFGRWQKGPDFQRPTALVAYRYLGRYPAGEHAREILEWLLAYEEGRGNAIAALRIADFSPGFDAKKRAELAEESAAQALSAAKRVKRSDRRSLLLRSIVREYPDTPSGQAAGRLARRELVEGSAQQIRITRSFLKENPRVAGRAGLGLDPILLNGEIDDGELHPRGVSFLGGQRLRIDLVGSAGDEEEDEPDSVHRTISAERLARLVSTLDETARRNQLLDGDDRLAADADRDQFIERARLGLARRPDARATARSTYVYRSMRERYGMVRGRESILPFDLVLQGDFTDLTLGAFPRWRTPKETPDAFLYR